MREIEIVIDESGVARFLSHEADEVTRELACALGGSTRRASHVVPRSMFLRLAFRLFRLAGDTGLLAAWTRGWSCDWVVDLSPSGGGLEGPFSCRSEAIDFEQQWLVRRWVDA